MTTTSTARRVETVAFAGPTSLRVSHDSAQQDLAPGHARIRVLASSLTLSDSIVRRGLNPYTSALTLPFTIGYDFVGRVEEIREPAAGIAVGDLVVDLVRAGGNADVQVRQATGLTRVAAEIEPLLLEPLVMTGVTAYQMLHRAAGIQAGQTILVHGATGGVGLLAVELGVLAGARVLATGSPAKHAALATRGAEPVDGRAPDLADQVMALARQGVDAVFDGVGGPSRATVGGTLRPGGVLVGFGFAGPAAQARQRSPESLDHAATAFAEGRAILDDIERRGDRTVEFEVGSGRDEDRSAYDDDLDSLVGHVLAGRLRPLVEPVSFDEVVSAHARIDAGAVTGRLVLDHQLPTAAAVHGIGAHA